MRLQVRNQNVEFDGDLKQNLERRLAFALGRFESRIESVAVFLSDQNGPRGGLDKRCRMLVKLRGGPQVVIESWASSAEHAIDDGADRLSHAVSRQIARTRLRRRVGESPW